MAYSGIENKFLNKTSLAELIALVKQADAADKLALEKVIGVKNASAEAVALTVGTGEAAVTYNDLKSYVDALLTKGVTDLDAVEESATLGSATEYVAPDSPAEEADVKVNVKVTQVDGLITAVDVATEDIASAALLAQEIAKRKEAIAALDANVADGMTIVNDEDTVTAAQKVGIRIVETDGKLTSAKVITNDIASADELAKLQAVVGYSVLAAEGQDAKTVKARLEAAEAEIIKFNGDKDVTGSIDQKVNTAVVGLIDGAPAALDTLKEIADWIANQNESGVTDVASLVARVDANTAAIAKDSLVVAEGDAKTVPNAIAKAVADINTAIEGLDADEASADLGTATAYKAAAGEEEAVAAVEAGVKVKVQVTETDGVVDGVVVTTNDIASKVLLDQEIAQRKEAIAALNATVESAAGDDVPVRVTVTEAAGKLTEVTATMNAFTVADIDAIWAETAAKA